MRIKIFLLFILALFIMLPETKAQIQCDIDSTGIISLVDLQTDYYVSSTGSYQGGLYPGGSNYLPPAHRKAGIEISKSIKPLDSLGNVDWVNGVVGMTAFGASTTGEPFNHFIDIIHPLDYINPCLKVVTGTYGGKGLEIMQYPDLFPWYWDYVLGRIDSGGGLSPEQVQIAWFKSGSKADTIVEMPTMANGIADRYEACLQLLKGYFPNLKIVYMSGFYYGGYGDPTKEFYDVISEPGGFYNNFSTKYVIERQINGDPDLKFTEPDRKSPWIAWGPHEWADGLRANEWDGLFWECETDFSVDGGGYHMTNAGKEKEAQLLLKFFSHDVTARRWFLDNPKWNSCDPFGKTSDGKDLNTADDNSYKAQDIQLYPSPNNGNFYVRFVKPHEGYVKLSIVNNLGDIVFTSELTSFIPNQGYTIDIKGSSAGIYHLQVNIDGQILSKEFIVN